MSTSPSFLEAPAALIAGKVYRFPDESALAETRALLAKVMALPGPDSAAPFTAALEEETPPSSAAILQAAGVAAGAWTESPKTVLVLNCVFPNKTTAVGTRAQWVAVMKEVSDWLRASSYGKTSLTATVPPNVFKLPSKSTVYEPEKRHAVLMEDARKLALEAGFDPEDYDITVVAFPRLNWTWGGLATIGGGSQWLNGVRSASTIAHEFGHNYGVWHANSWDANDRTVMPATGAPGDTDPRHTEYGDLYSVMGVSGNYPAGDYSMHGKAELNWITPEQVKTVTAPGTYRIHRFDHAGASAHPSLALKLQRGPSQTFWIGHRRNFKTNPSLSGGAYVIWQYDAHSARLLDLTPDSKKGTPRTRGTPPWRWGKHSGIPPRPFSSRPRRRGARLPMNGWM